MEESIFDLNDHARTDKQRAVDMAVAELPQEPGEPKMAWRRRLAKASGCSPGYVYSRLQILAAIDIGRVTRAKRIKEAAEKRKVAIYNAETSGLIQGFRGWGDAFMRIKMVCETYEQFARERGDVYAKSFLAQMSEICTRAQERAAMS